MMKKEWIVEGFRFLEEEEARIASKEAEGIRYIKQNLNRNHPESVLQVYLKLIQDEVFYTSLGLSYLKELQIILQESPLIMEGEIIPIVVPKREELKEIVEKEVKEAKKKAALKENKGPKKKMFQSMIIVNIFLIITVILMFVLSTTSKTPTIINYKNKIIDQYEHWDQELSQRELKIEKKERELQIDQNDKGN